MYHRISIIPVAYLDLITADRISCLEWSNLWIFYVLNNNTMLKEVIGGLQELMVMDENVCELIRRGVNGLRARLLHFVIMRWEK